MHRAARLRFGRLAGTAEEQAIQVGVPEERITTESYG